ncbi:MAG: Tox-REase-5 domain-containing protein [Novosphingobium sp.]
MLADYQRQITHTPKLLDNLMLEYRVTNELTGQQVNFDGCAYWSPEHALLEAKGGDTSLYRAAETSKSASFRDSVNRDIADQARRQFRVVGEVQPVEYHVADSDIMNIVVQGVDNGTFGATNFVVQHTPQMQETGK